MSIKIKCKVFFRNRFGLKLSQNDIRGYRNILKLLYHKKAETPLKDPEYPEYFIQVPSLHLDLIIDLNKAELINSTQIYPLELHPKVLERAIKSIKEEVSRQRGELKIQIRGKKETILNNVYKTIK